MRKVIYEDTYVRPGLKINKDWLPTVPSVEGVVVEAFVLRDGALRDESGRRREYQELRVYFRGRNRRLY